MNARKKMFVTTAVCMLAFLSACGKKASEQMSEPREDITAREPAAHESYSTKETTVTNEEASTHVNTDVTATMNEDEWRYSSLDELVKKYRSFDISTSKWIFSANGREKARIYDGEIVTMSAQDQYDDYHHTGVYPALPDNIEPNVIDARFDSIDQYLFVDDGGMHLYGCGQEIQSWPIEYVADDAQIVRRPDYPIGLISDGNYIVCKDDGTTEMKYEHVIDHGCIDICFWWITTFSDGQLAFYWSDMDNSSARCAQIPDIADVCVLDENYDEHSIYNERYYDYLVTHVDGITYLCSISEDFIGNDKTAIPDIIYNHPLGTKPIGAYQTEYKLLCDKYRSSRINGRKEPTPYEAMLQRYAS